MCDYSGSTPSHLRDCIRFVHIQSLGWSTTDILSHIEMYLNCFSDLVLTAEQKKIRFRRLLKKQQKRQKAKNTSIPVRKKPPRIQSQSQNSSESINESSFIGDLESLGAAFDNVRWQPRRINDGSFFEKTLETISHEFGASFQDINKDPFFVNVVRKVGLFHTGNGSEIITLEELHHIYIVFEKQFFKFANLLSDFYTLSDGLKQQLIRFNTPLYVHFLVTEYLGSHTGQMQVDLLNNLSCGMLNQQSSSIPSFLAYQEQEPDHNYFLSLNYFQSVIHGLFSTVENLMINDTYVGEIQTIINHKNSFEFRAFVSFLILFNLDPRISSGSNEVETISNLTNGFLQWYKQKYDAHLDFRQFVRNLEFLSQFRHFRASSLHDPRMEPQSEEGPGQFIPKQLVVPYTENEEKWLQRQFLRISDVFKTVRFGENVIHEFTMHSLGVPLSKKYFKNVISIMLERQKQVYKLHEEFRSLPHLVQSGLICMNSLITSSLFGARYEICKTGIEQLEISQIEVTDWDDYFSTVFRNKEALKPIYLRDSISSIPCVGSTENLELFSRIIREVQDVVSNPELFKMMLVIILTRHLGKDVKNPLENLHTSYKLLLARRANWLVKSNKLCKNLAAESVTKRVFVAIDQLEGLSKLLLLIMINS